MIRVFVYVGDVKVTGANYQLVITEKKTTNDDEVTYLSLIFAIFMAYLGQQHQQ